MSSPSSEQCSVPEEQQESSDRFEEDSFLRKRQEPMSGFEEFGSHTRKHRTSKRTLEIEYWDRSDETRRRKEEHTKALDENPEFESREDYILATILAGKQIHFEPNMFPYDCPPGIEHWTLWSRETLTTSAIEDLVENWLLTNLPGCVAWEFDDNDSRSFDIEHVHIYFKIGDHKQASNEVS
eukprot:TRINITY_DN26385_c0_g1_i1.p1 TRINITY_DN26385_c0_g1~~TRINITY_DN26385_c0_g1_i1.p1  ORF type:complete len:182 (+),score=2.17 TRINITY_DN26385_c0_g1_i1:176-721(+)